MNFFMQFSGFGCISNVWIPKTCYPTDAYLEAFFKALQKGKGRK